jgi:hypothetical protein
MNAIRRSAALGRFVGNRGLLKGSFSSSAAPSTYFSSGSSRSSAFNDCLILLQKALCYAAVGLATVIVTQGGASDCDDKGSRPVMSKESIKSNSTIKIFAGNANKMLAEDIARILGIRLGNIKAERFPDGEVNLSIRENVRGKDVYIVQPTSPPVNENLMELLLLISTMRRASARKITAVIPYYGYARQVFTQTCVYITIVN